MEESVMNMQEKIQKTMQALEKNNMQAFYVESKEEAKTKVAQLLHDSDVVSTGGSVTLQQIGVMDLLRSGRYQFLDRAKEGLTREQVEDIYRRTFCADAYLCSSNAVTVNGELYNVDGNSNRVAAILYGPKSVIMVVGCNKIVESMEEAVRRVKETAAPLNTKRLNCETYCKETGRCVSLGQEGAEMPSGCASAARICCNYVVSAQQRHVGRIKVILVGESLGY
ncbi:MAG: lactate utilization protein [Clostridiales bacterium]|nr:lactate utilization protein [Clostridiales bacterium]